MRGQFVFSIVCCSRFHLQLIAINCNRRECRQRTCYWLKCSARARHVISMVIQVVRLTLCSLTLFFSVCVSYPLLFSFHFYLKPDLSLFLHVVDIRAIDHWHSANWGGLLAEFTPLTGYEPNISDDFHYSETTEITFQDEFGDIDTEPSYLLDAELDDETIGRALSSPLFFQEREEPADRRQTYHSFDVSLLPAQSHRRTEFVKFVQQRKAKSRLRKRSNQDSLWTTKRANSRWFTRISSPF